jgi:hypothetical protein
VLAEFSFGNYFWHTPMVCKIMGILDVEEAEDGSYVARFEECSKIKK